MSKRRLLLTLALAGIACVTCVVTYFVATDRGFVAPFAGVATAIAVLCAMVPVWMQHK
ncbi:MAG TPA: hypothetical protein VK157_12745 [Phycisphaerales bacterium]|nr:hypothetical protein [Phycisphaerales bacterium]